MISKILDYKNSDELIPLPLLPLFYNVKYKFLAFDKQ
jgi:hypothetical protein